MIVLRPRRGATGSKYLTFRGGVRRPIPILLVGSGQVRWLSVLYGIPEAGVPSRRLTVPALTVGCRGEIRPGTRLG